VLPQQVLAQELGLDPRAGALLRGLLRYVVPPVSAAVSLAALLV
jgi:hypothetical protein